jgi:hypothetical protein
MARKKAEDTPVMTLSGVKARSEKDDETGQE